MFGVHKKKPIIPGQIYTAPVAAPAKPVDCKPSSAVLPPASSLDKLLRTLETLAIGALTAGALAAFQALATPDVFLHPHKITSELIGAGIGGMALYVRKSTWVQKALAAGQAAGTDDSK